jgi:hypothetical protein
MQQICGSTASASYLFYRLHICTVMWPESDRARTLPLSLYAGSILSLPETFSEPGHAFHLLEFLFGEQAKDDISAIRRKALRSFGSTASLPEWTTEDRTP